jgi:deazaflavin-dependent oxidoreductase (nitroreductase family)
MNSPTQFNQFNERVIEEFRANVGKVGGRWEGAHLLLLTTTGAKSGRRRTFPLAYLPDGDRLVVFATKGGSPTNPAWYHNLKAYPEVTVEAGTETFDATAVEVTGAERDRLYARQVALRPAFGDYEKKTTRKIPVFALERRKG